MVRSEVGLKDAASSALGGLPRLVALGAVLLLAGCKGGGGDSLLPPSAAAYYQWMSSEVQTAWDQGFLGQGTRVRVVDDFTSGDIFSGDLGPGAVSQQHGDWVRQIVRMIAPEATVSGLDYDTTSAVTLSPGLNILNLSYGIYAPPGSSGAWDNLQGSIITAADEGLAVVVKSAGNDGVAVGTPNTGNKVDYLSLDLIGSQTALFVGALSSNGTVANPASMASYSNTAGTDPQVQSQFLVVGVDGDSTGLYGTSFAAPIVSGYAAVLGSKFTTATPAQIADQLLLTARKDTILNYNIAVHGQGEASIANALAPQSIQ